jgi:protein gp37
MDEARRQMFRIMARTAYGLDYLVLTKRPGHARTLWKELLEVYRDELELAVGIEPRLKPALEYTRRTGMMPNIWPGTTAEAQRYVRQRFDELCGIPAVRRFASIEPQVEPVEIGEYLSKNADLPGSDGLHWIIQGGESGNADNIRPFHPDWARKTRDECAAAGVPYFLKQWGEVLPADHATVDVIDKPHHLIWHEKSIPVKDQTEMANMQAEQKAGRVALPMIGYRVGKKSAGRTLDGRTHDAIPVSVF